MSHRRGTSEKRRGLCCCGGGQQFALGVRDSPSMPTGDFERFAVTSVARSSSVRLNASLGQ